MLSWPRTLDVTNKSTSDAISVVATKFVLGRGCDYGSCWNYDIVTKRPCSLLYVEMNIFDSSDSLVDWTNSTARNVVAGEIVKVQMNTFEDAAESGRITEITCS